MRHFGTIVFGCLTAVAILGVLWLSHGAGASDGLAAVFGLAVSPTGFIAKHPQVHEVGTNPEMNWVFRTNGTFSATSASSTYGFIVTGKWDVVSDDQVHILGTSTNTRTQVVRHIENTITNIQVWRLSESDPPQVILKKVKNIEAFEMQPTRPRTIP